MLPCFQYDLTEQLGILNVKKGSIADMKSLIGSRVRKYFKKHPVTCQQGTFVGEIINLERRSGEYEFQVKFSYGITLWMNYTSIQRNIID